MHFDPLESRRLYSIASTLDGYGTLVVQGDGANDVITVQESGSTLLINQSPADMSWTPPPTTAIVMQTLSKSLSYAYLRPPIAVGGSVSLSAVKKIVVRGGAGDDLIVVNSSIPADVGGEDGNDVVYGSFADDRLDGGNGNDQLQGRRGNDVLLGGPGNDMLGGDDGNDNVSGGDDTDILMDDAGNDTYAGGAGRDLLTYNSHPFPVYPAGVIIIGSVGQALTWLIDQGNYGAETDQFTDVEDFIGTAGDDIIEGTQADNTIQGGFGNDIIAGWDGNDQIYGQDGDDQVYGEAGNDSLYGDAGNDTLDGGDGDDALDGGAGSDDLAGGDGNDVLYARDLEVDHLDGGAGFDQAYADKIHIGFATYLLDDLANVEYW